MKKCLRYLGIAAVILGLTFGALYEANTHVVRGWLRGEAFYDGRPTSYWRERCDEWIGRHDTPEQASRDFGVGRAVPILDHDELTDYERLCKPRPAAVWSQLFKPFRSDEFRKEDYWPPKVLFGRSDAEPVLKELAKEDQYKIVAERALRYVMKYREMRGQ